MKTLWVMRSQPCSQLTPARAGSLEPPRSWPLEHPHETQNLTGRQSCSNVCCAARRAALLKSNGAFRVVVFNGHEQVCQTQVLTREENPFTSKRPLSGTPRHRLRALQRDATMDQKAAKQNCATFSYSHGQASSQSLCRIPLRTSLDHERFRLWRVSSTRHRTREVRR